MTIKPKRHGLEIQMRTFSGRDGRTYLVFRTSKGAFHAFREVEAKQAASACGARSGTNTRQMWEHLWKKR